MHQEPRPQDPSLRWAQIPDSIAIEAPGYAPYTSSDLVAQYFCQPHSDVVCAINCLLWARPDAAFMAAHFERDSTDARGNRCCMDERRPNLALRLVEERARLGYSQADFARKVGVSREGLRLYESGQRGIAAEFLAESASLGLDVQYVLTGMRSKNNPGDGHTPGQPLISMNSSGGNVVGVVQSGATIHQITTAKHVTRTVAQVKPGAEHITEAQAVVLTTLVNDVLATEARLKQSPATHRKVWGQLNAHCGVTQYRMIRLEDFEKARSYLQQWAGRLNSMPSAPVKNGDEWRKRHYAYIKIIAGSPSWLLTRRGFALVALTLTSHTALAWKLALLDDLVTSSPDAHSVGSGT